MPRAELLSEVREVGALAPPLVARLLELQRGSYDGVLEARFFSDLAEKQWVILLRDARTSEVVGFSTQRTLEVNLAGRAVRALFSGDTIVHPDFWGEQALVRAWCRLAGRVKAETPDHPLYWFLISKGHRTYLYLPTFFREFYPRHDAETPAFESELIRALGSARYGDEFDPSAGTIAPRGPCDSLRVELDAAPRRLKNPHVAFFLRANPGYARGHELACVAEISPGNMCRIARSELLAGMASAGDGVADDVNAVALRAAAS